MLTVCPGVLSAGPLAPAAGPVGPSMKTLTEVQPRIAVSAANTPGDADSQFVISQPGSYYLTGNIIGVAGKNCIKVTANNVTLDLNGFTLSGVANSLDGVHAYPSSRVMVRNGMVSYFTGRGVYIGAGGAVTDVTVDHCGGVGILTTQSCSVQNCQAIANNSNGVSVMAYSQVAGCLCDGNAGDGIVTVGAASVTRCVSAQNNQSGIRADDGSTVNGCACSNNATDGVSASDTCTVTENTCANNGDDGIQVGANCLVQRNSCNGNGPAASGAGVYASGAGNAIESNTLIGNHYGVLANGSNAGTLVVKNTAHANTVAFSVAAGNRFATPITDPNGAGVTPLSNISY
jgi:parallel beta-helix repeat protein